MNKIKNKKVKKIIQTIFETSAVVYTSMVLFYIGMLDIFLGVSFRGYIDLITMAVLIHMLLYYKVKECRGKVIDDE